MHILVKKKFFIIINTANEKLEIELPEPKHDIDKNLDRIKERFRNVAFLHAIKHYSESEAEAKALYMLNDLQKQDLHEMMTKKHVIKNYISVDDLLQIKSQKYFEKFQELELALEVDSTDSFSNPVINQNNLTSLDYRAVITFVDGTYFWRVWCKDSVGNWGDWSETWLFTISTLETGTVTCIGSP